MDVGIVCFAQKHVGEVCDNCVCFGHGPVRACEVGRPQSACSRASRVSRVRQRLQLLALRSKGAPAACKDASISRLSLMLGLNSGPDLSGVSACLLRARHELMNASSMFW